MAQDAHSSAAENVHPDPVDLIKGPDRSPRHYWCGACGRLQTYDHELPVRGEVCADCGSEIGTLDRIEYSSLQDRVFALVVDLAAAAAIYVVFSVFFFPFSPLVPQDENGDPTARFLLFSRTISVVVAFFYISYGDVLGVSLGRAFAGIRVVRKATMRAPGPFIGLLRVVGKVLMLGTGGLGYLMLARDRESRALHDRIAGTRVIYRRTNMTVR